MNRPHHFPGELRLILLLIASGFILLLSGCRKNSTYKSGIFTAESSTISWMTYGDKVLFAVKTPQSTDYSNILAAADSKSSALSQFIKIDTTRIFINAYLNSKGEVESLRINNNSFDPGKISFIELNKSGEVINTKLLIPEDIIRKIISESANINPLRQPDEPVFWLILGFIAQLLFSSRMLIQWYASEKAKKSVVPVMFWYFSLGGSGLLLSYAIYRQDPVFILGQGFGFIVYVRNLILIAASENTKKSGGNKK